MAELHRPLWGGFQVSPAGVYRVLRRHGLGTRQKRLGLVAGYACPPDPLPRDEDPERHLDASHPGSLVQMGAFAIGRLSGTKGVVWQYTAIDVASSYVWAELHTSPRNPTAHWCSHLAEEIAKDLSSWGWKLEVLVTDNASEFRSHEFEEAVRKLGATHRFIRAGRPQSNGRVERVQRTILQGVLEAGVRSLPHPQIHRPEARPQTLHQLLQLRSGPHRPTHERKDPPRGPWKS